MDIGKILLEIFKVIGVLLAFYSIPFLISRGIAGCIYTWDTPANGNGASQNLIASLDGDYSRGSYEIVGAAGANDHSYTTGSNSRTIMSAVAYAPSVGASTSVKDIIGGFIPFAR